MTNITIIIQAGFALIAFGLIVYVAFSYIKQNKAIREKMEDLPVQDVIEEYKYNGKSLYLSVDDQRVWNTLTRDQKREIHRQNLKKLASGMFFIVTDASGKTGILRRADAVADGFVVKVHYQGKNVYMHRIEALKKGLI